MPRFTAWLQRHRLSAFVVLAFAISWSAAPLSAVDAGPGHSGTAVPRPAA